MNCNTAEEWRIVTTEEQDEDPADGWLSDDRHRLPNGSRVREDFTVDPELSCTNTDFGGDDPGRVEEKSTATFDPTEVRVEE